MLQVKNIYKSYGDVKVLNDVSLEVHDGEIVAITGPSGAGKTTLLQILGTLDRPDMGKLIFDGRDALTFSNRALSLFRNATIGFVFQSHQLLPEFTLLENVMMPALIAGKGEKRAKERAKELLEEVGLAHRLSHKPSQLSGGECQRGAVARALMNEPALILADEPTGNLDSANSNELQNLFFDMRRRHGSSFVIVTHDTNLAARCDRIIKISDGKIVK